MKSRKIILSMVTLFGWTGLLLTQSPLKVAAQSDFKVLEVSLKPDDSKPTGKCPVRVNFRGYIKVSGAGTVKYTFTRSDGAVSPVYELKFENGRSKPVSTDWTLGDASVLPSYVGWRAIKILSPNEKESSREDGAFSPGCLGTPPQQRAGKADLIVEKAALSLGQRCVAGEPILYADVRIKNIGTAASEARTDVGFAGAMDSDGTNWGNGIGLPAIAPGASFTTRFPI